MSTTRGTVTKAQISAVAMLDARDVFKGGPIDVANELGTNFWDIMKWTDRVKEVTNSNYHHFVDEDLFPAQIIDAVTGSGTATLSVTLTTTGYVRPGVKLRFPNDKIGIITSAITTASSKDSFTVKSADGSNLTAAATNALQIAGLTVGEASKAPGGLYQTPTKYFNQVEIMRENDQITDVQKIEKLEFDNYFAYYLAITTLGRFKASIANTLLTGQKSVNQFGTASPTLTDVNGGSVQTTGGLVQEITTYGVNDTVTTLGTPVLADLDDLNDQLLAVKASGTYLVGATHRAWTKWADVFKNLTGASGLTSGRLNMDGKEIDLNIQSVTRGKFTYEFTPFDTFDHPQYAASAMGKSMYGFPKDKVKVVGGGTEPRVSVAYMKSPFVKGNMGNDIIQEWQTGALAGDSDECVLGTHFRTMQGMDVKGAKHMFAQRVAS